MRLFHTQNKTEAAPSSGWLVPSADGTTGNDVVFRGDSITWGIGGNSLPGGTYDGWTKKLSTLKGWTENNFNMSGYVISDPGACVARPKWDITDASAGVPTKTASLRYLFIAFGVNDHFLANSNVTAAQYQAAIETAIDYATGTKGWQNRRIIVLPPYWTNFDNSAASNYCSPGVITDATRKAAFIAAAQAAASGRGTNYYNIYQYMADNGGNSLLDDGIHPNNAGHTAIANALNSFIP